MFKEIGYEEPYYSTKKQAQYKEGCAKLLPEV
jgi:hypothetical protein